MASTSEIMMRFEIFESYPELHYGISSKTDGFMNFDTRSDQKMLATAVKNRHSFLESKKISKYLEPQLVQGDKIAVVSETNYHNVGEADGFLTATPDLYLLVTVADCFPLFFYDPDKKVASLVHCGWRGVTKNITTKATEAFIDSFGSDPSDLLLGIGPGLQQHHFEFNSGAEKNFNGASHHISHKNCQTYVDLPGIISNQARLAGVRRIESSKLCTYCLNDTYFSYRRDAPKVPEVMLAYMGIS